MKIHALNWKSAKALDGSRVAPVAWTMRPFTTVAPAATRRGISEVAVWSAVAPAAPWRLHQTVLERGENE